ncbi:hypothetical protein NQ314_001726, partial [Rhamnusium bicolor]
PSSCGSPDKLINTTIVGNDYDVGSSIEYKCPEGHMLVGDSERDCGKNGFWSGHAPTCKYIDCGGLPGLDHGSVALQDQRTTHGAKALYTCHENYTLIGHEIRTCGDDGIWTNSTPKCLFDWCPDPPAIHGGIVTTSGSYVVGYDFNVHSSIEYNCEVGHILRGEANHVCERDGEWSGNTPSCEYIDCGKVPTMLYGNMDYLNGTTYLNSVITYSCVKNYRLNGVPKRICLENKQWSDSSPKCEEIRCPEPILAEHSILSVTGNDRMYGRTLIRTAESANVGATSYKIGALVKYRCERGYKVVGEPLSTCEDTGKWSGDVPQCVYVDCGSPEKVENGKITLPSNATYYGALALYACDPNFELDGVSRRLCLENGTWSSEAPKCREIQCKKPDALEGVTYKISTLSVGGVAQYHCPRGHIMQGNSTRMCLKNGIWSGSAPSCLAVDCNHPGTIENGRIIVMNGTIYNSAIEYHCVPNFERIGPYLRKCMDNGEWSGDEPRCEKGAERKEDRNAAVMSYATLSDRNGYTHPHLATNIYENIHEDNMYDAPYEETSRDSGTYEPEPIGRSNGNVITINGVSVR